MRLGELEGVVAEEDGYSAESDAAVLLDGLDIPEPLHQRKMGELQGGQKVRVLLAQALFGRPEALLREILSRLDRIEARLPPLPAGAAAAEASAPLSDGQREVLQLAALAPEAPAAFHLTAVLELTRQLEAPSLRRALQELMDRHESLRTELDRDGARARIRPAVEVEALRMVKVVLALAAL